MPRFVYCVKCQWGTHKSDASTRQSSTIALHYRQSSSISHGMVITKCSEVITAAISNLESKLEEANSHTLLISKLDVPAYWQWEPELASLAEQDKFQAGPCHVAFATYHCMACRNDHVACWILLCYVHDATSTMHSRAYDSRGKRGNSPSALL